VHAFHHHEYEGFEPTLTIIAAHFFLHTIGRGLSSKCIDIRETRSLKTFTRHRQRVFKRSLGFCVCFEGSLRGLTGMEFRNNSGFSFWRETNFSSEDSWRVLQICQRYLFSPKSSSSSVVLRLPQRRFRHCIGSTAHETNPFREKGFYVHTNHSPRWHLHNASGSERRKFKFIFYPLIGVTRCFGKNGGINSDSIFLSSVVRRDSQAAKHHTHSPATALWGEKARTNTAHTRGSINLRAIPLLI
jgi:hypothetical protein